MNNSFLSSLGLENLDLGIVITVMLIVIILLIIWNIINMRAISKMKKKYARFMTGKSAKSLEDEISGLFEDNRFLKSSIEKNKKDIHTLYKRMESTFQKIGIIKYDAFNQMGGKLSFSLALLDENNNGFVLNSVHSADGCYSYTKEITNGECAISLGEEEKQALEMAMEKTE